MNKIIVGFIALSSISTVFANVCGSVGQLKVSSAAGAFDSVDTAVVEVQNSETNALRTFKVQGASVINLLVTAKLAKANVCISDEHGSSGFQTATLK